MLTVAITKPIKPVKSSLLVSLLGIASDLGLWLAITLLTVGITAIFDMDAKQLIKHKTTIMLTLQDAYSLSKGSMVRLMGVPIGYVENVKLAPNNSVVVLLKLNPDIPNLPAGAKGTVVAYGLGGSKSLDFEMPRATEKQATNGREALLSVSNPLRQKALLQAQIEVAKTLEAGANSLAESLSQFPTIQQQGNIAKVRVDSTQMIRGQEHFIQSLIQFQHQLSFGADSAKTLVDTFRSSTEKTDKWVNLYSPKVLESINKKPITFELPANTGNILGNTRSLLGISQGLQVQVKGLQAEFKPINTKLLQLENSIRKFTQQLNETKPSSAIEKNRPWQKQPLGVLPENEASATKALSVVEQAPLVLPAPLLLKEQVPTFPAEAP